MTDAGSIVFDADGRDQAALVHEARVPTRPWGKLRRQSAAGPFISPRPH